MKRSIASQWDLFRAAVIPPSAGAMQLRETKRAFYAGARALLALMEQIAANDEPDDVGADSIEQLLQECVQFAQQVEAGKA